MSTAQTTMTSNTPDESKTTKVWDPVVRIGHWVIVLGVITAYLTGDEIESIHVWAGYTIAVTVSIRILWGFIGPKQARFAAFVKGPRAVLGYLRGLMDGTAQRTLGHNAAGAAMVVALLISLVGTTLSGMTLLAIEEGEGPLAGIVSRTLPAEGGSAWSDRAREADDEEPYDDAYYGGAGYDDEREEVVEALHSTFVYLTLTLAGLHILGVLASSLAHGENLAASMLTGRKRSI